MKKIILLFTTFLLLNSFDTKQVDSYAVGEFVKLRIHYGLINAGYATLEVKRSVNLMVKRCTMLLGKVIQLE